MCTSCLFISVYFEVCSACFNYNFFSKKRTSICLCLVVFSFLMLPVIGQSQFYSHEYLHQNSLSVCIWVQLLILHQMLTFQKSIIFLNKNQTLLYLDFKFFSCILKYFTQSLKSEFCKKLVTKSGTECDVLAIDKWQNR